MIKPLRDIESNASVTAGAILLSRRTLALLSFRSSRCVVQLECLAKEGGTAVKDECILDSHGTERNMKSGCPQLQQ